MDKEYVDLLTGENLSSIWVANLDPFVGQFFNLVEGGGDGVRELTKGRVHKNLVQHPSTNISIVIWDKTEVNK